MSRKAQGKGRSRGLDPEEFRKLADGNQLAGVLSAKEVGEPTRIKSTVGSTGLPRLDGPRSRTKITSNGRKER